RLGLRGLLREATLRGAGGAGAHERERDALGLPVGVGGDEGQREGVALRRELERHRAPCLGVGEGAARGGAGGGADEGVAVAARRAAPACWRVGVGGGPVVVPGEAAAAGGAAAKGPRVSMMASPSVRMGPGAEWWRAALKVGGPSPRANPAWWGGVRRRSRLL